MWECLTFKGSRKGSLGALHSCPEIEVGPKDVDGELELLMIAEKTSYRLVKTHQAVQMDALGTISNTGEYGSGARVDVRRQICAKRAYLSESKDLSRTNFCTKSRTLGISSSQNHTTLITTFIVLRCSVLIDVYTYWRVKMFRSLSSS